MCSEPRASQACKPGQRTTEAAVLEFECNALSGKGVQKLINLVLVVVQSFEAHTHVGLLLRKEGILVVVLAHRHCLQLLDDLLPLLWACMPGHGLRICGTLTAGPDVRWAQNSGA